jgi:oxygen-independent coproporphyrinogen-3 oxidase
MEAVLDAGFKDISVDLIYGSPTTTDVMWQKNLEKAISYGVRHISAYCLTVEEKTALHHFIEKKKMVAPDAERALRQFDMLQDILQDNGYMHYEISNFCLPGFEAVHNTAYWQGKPYLGIGPSAHSYDGRVRCWNVSNNKQYIDAMRTGELPIETETLTQTDRYNEYIMTGLRTMWGLSQKELHAFGEPYFGHFNIEVEQPLEAGLVMRRGESYILSREGKKVADGVAARLFYVG